jgi:glutathione S-transferase
VVFGAYIYTVKASAGSPALLNVVQHQLCPTGFWGGAPPTIADIAFYSYVAHAPEGNVSLADYPHVRAWLASIEALPGFVGMPRTAAGLQSQ